MQTAVHKVTAQALREYADAHPDGEAAAKRKGEDASSKKKSDLAKGRAEEAQRKKAEEVARKKAEEEKKRKKAEEAFARLDTNHDGVISKEEFALAMESGWNPGQPPKTDRGMHGKGSDSRAKVGTGESKKIAKIEEAAERKRRAELEAAAQKQGTAPGATRPSSTARTATKDNAIDHTASLDQLREKIRSNNRRLECNARIIASMERRGGGEEGRVLEYLKHGVEICDLKKKLAKSREICHDMRDPT